MKKFKYTITKLFINGNLKGLKYEESTDIKFELKKVYKTALGSDYKIIKIVTHD